MTRARGWIGAAAVALLLIATAGAVIVFRKPWLIDLSELRDQPFGERAPVIMVHGYVAGACPGISAAHDAWGDLYVELTAVGWRGPLLPVSFYQCDTDGVDITGYGPQVPAGASAQITRANPRVHYTQATPIDQLAHDLAWFIYDTYSRRGLPALVVGVSMGGLIIRDALYRVAAADPRFPPDLIVPRAVTISTPHAGYLTTATNAAFCEGSTECDEFASDSPFIAELTAHAQNPQGAGSTTWTLLGSSAECDFVPASSSLAMTAATRIDYQSPCYQHTAYLFDAAPTSDAHIRIRSPGSATVRTDRSAPHSLAIVVDALAGRLDVRE